MVIPAIVQSGERRVFEIVSPCPAEHYVKVWGWLQEFSRETLDASSPRSLEQLVEKSRRDRESGGREYLIVKGGEPAGAVWCESVGDGIGLGHLVFDRYLLPGAQKLMAARAAIEMMFGAGFRKIVWPCFADNRPFRIFLRRLGAEQEALLKRHARRGEAWVDALLMASFPGADL